MSIVDYAMRYAEVRKDGARFKCLCFFHAESTPSFSLDPKENLFHCFGCGKSGNLIQLCMELDKLDFNEAVRVLLNGLPPAPNQRPDPDGKEAALERKADQTFRRYEKHIEFPLATWMQYHQALLGSDLAAQEFNLRGIRRGTLMRYKVGYLQNGHKITNPEAEEFHGVRDEPWIGFGYIYGDRVRLIKWRPVHMSNKASKRFVRVSKMKDVLFIDGEPDPFEDVILVSGEIDAMTLSQVGYRVASLPSGDQTRVMGEIKDWLLGFRKVYLAIDNDPSGLLCIRKLLALLPADRTAIVKIPPEYKDANGLYVKACGCDDEKFRAVMDGLLNAAERPSTVFFESLDEAFEQYAQYLATNRDHRNFWEWPWKEATDMADIRQAELVVVASERSKMGKTSLMVQSSVHNGRYLGRRIGYYTAEMDTIQELVPMVTAQVTCQDRRDLEPGDVEQARAYLANCELYFGYDPTAKTWEDVLDLLEMAVKRLGLDVIVIDHLDFIIRDPDWRKEMSMKSMASKQLLERIIHKYGTLVIVLRQMNKPKDQGRRRKGTPDIYNIPGGIAGLTDIHHGFVIWREQATSLEEGKDQDTFQNETKFICDLTRHKGPGGKVVTLEFKGKFARFDRPRQSGVEGPNPPPPPHQQRVNYDGKEESTGS
jgi:hypothetical protein